MGEPPDFPAALEPPPGPLTLIDRAAVQRAIDASRRSPRRRVILPFHREAADPLQRMLNVLQPGSYIRPHRHVDPPRPESLVVLRGAIQYVVFDAAGGITESLRVEPAAGCFGIDTDPGIFHSFYALAEDTVLYEVKPGPYEAARDKDFAGWAPEEWSEAASAWLHELYRRTGARPA